MSIRDDIIRNYFLSFRDRHNDELYERVERLEEIVRTNPLEGWSIVRELISEATSDEELDFVAAGPLEELLLLHSSRIAKVIREEALRDARVRKALAYVLLDPLPQEVDGELGEWVPKLR